MAKDVNLNPDACCECGQKSFKGLGRDTTGARIYQCKRCDRQMSAEAANRKAVRRIVREN